MFIFDSNFAIMIRDFIVNEERFRKEYSLLYEEFVFAINLIEKYSYRIVYHYACEEASRDKKTGTINIDKYKLMVSCFETLFKIETNDNLIIESTGITESIENTKIPLLKNNGLYKNISIVNYTMLLKAFMIEILIYNTQRKKK